MVNFSLVRYLGTTYHTVHTSMLSCTKLWAWGSSQSGYRNIVGETIDSIISADLDTRSVISKRSANKLSREMRDEINESICKAGTETIRERQENFGVEACYIAHSKCDSTNEAFNSGKTRE